MVVYPRWRGELNIGNGFAAAASGLSPLARGTRPPRRCIPRDRRFIPAGAGNSFFPGIHFPDRAVYPRWRGELDSKPVTRTHQPGLSPLARGTHDIELSIYLFFRFIPAGAGNSWWQYRRRWIRAVYPRLRGELGWQHNEQNQRQRFIPAGAGNSLNITYY